MNGYRTSKYNNKRTTVDGIPFMSMKEAARYQELKIAQKAGLIKWLQLQPRFQIVPKVAGYRARYYVADFQYEQDGEQIVEDVKSPITQKNPVYTLKRQLFLWQYPQYVFRET